jgi:23S rRNA (guanosine2251-2'-O)-methyltransferase
MDKKIVLICDNIRSAHNVGSLLRTAEGLGLDKVYLAGYTPYPISKNDLRLPHIALKVGNRINKTSLNSEDSLKWMHVEDLSKLISKLKKQDFCIVAIEQSKTSIDVKAFETPNKTAFILGNEREGVQEDILKLADKTIQIPMLGKKESFNVVQAGAMVLYKSRFID